MQILTHHLISQRPRSSSFVPLPSPLVGSSDYESDVSYSEKRISIYVYKKKLFYLTKLTAGLTTKAFSLRYCRQGALLQAATVKVSLSQPTTNSQQSLSFSASSLDSAQATFSNFQHIPSKHMQYTEDTRRLRTRRSRSASARASKISRI